jgi:hypothetical protein
MLKVNILRTAPATPIDQAVIGKADQRFSQSTYGDYNLPPTWAKVVKVSGINFVDVQLVNGLTLTNVPVKSDSWVKKIDDNNATGHKNLPPVDSKVLLVFPDGIIENALVLCSGFDIQIPAQKKVLLVAGEETKDIEVDEFGWKTVIDKQTGERTLESPTVSGYKVTIQIDFQNKIIKTTQEFSGGSKNIINMDTNGMKLTDKNNNTIDMNTTAVQINGTNLEVLR